MNSQDILEAIGRVNDRDVADAARTGRRLPLWIRALGTAACLCLVCMGALMLFINGMGASAGGGGGEFAGGWYYYRLMDDNLYRYNGIAGSEKVLSGWQYDSWDTNDYGLYYKQNRRLYVIEHESGQKRLLYRSGLFESSHIGFELYGDDVIVSVYNKRKDSVYEVLIDGETGEVLENVMELTYGFDYWGQYSDLNYNVGGRELLLEPVRKGERYRFYITEKGLRLSDLQVDIWPEYCDGGLWFNVYDEDEDTETYFVVYPEGEKLLELAYSRRTMADGYMYWYDYDQTQPPGVDIWTMLCMELETGEIWELEVDTPGVDLEVLATDGKLMYSSFYAAKTVACWEIVYRDGRPWGLRLLDEDINS